MKQKTDVLQGTLALMVLKALDVLGPLHAEQPQQSVWPDVSSSRAARPTGA